MTRVGRLSTEAHQNKLKPRSISYQKIAVPSIKSFRGVREKKILGSLHFMLVDLELSDRGCRLHHVATHPEPKWCTRDSSMAKGIRITHGLSF